MKNIKHKLVLLVDELIQLRSSGNWEEISTSEQDNNLKEIIDALDALYFQVRNQIIIK